MFTSVTHTKCDYAATFPLRFSKTVAELPASVQAPHCPLEHPAELVGQASLPRVAIVMACAQAHAGARTLAHDDVETLFHEFGHALAGLLSRTQFQHVAGTRVALDFAEVPSTLLERYVWRPDVVRRFARHRHTGDALPESTLRVLGARRAQFAGLDEQRQALLALFDQRLHLGAPPAPAGTSFWSTQLYWALTRQHTLLPLPAERDAELERYHPHAFISHLVGYAASYYSCKFQFLYVFAKRDKSKRRKNVS